MLQIAVTAWLYCLGATALLLVTVVTGQALLRRVRALRLSLRRAARRVVEPAPVRAAASELVSAGSRAA